jgi:CelD/BcsL family acetyltransferase involved in cellulose biosynthesis
LQTDVIKDIGGLAAIEDEWQQLLLRTPRATSYASPAWVLTWLRHFEHKGGLHAVVVRRGGELVGLAPFAQSRFGAGRLGFRLLVPAGTEHGDYGEPLLGDDPCRWPRPSPST